MPDEHRDRAYQHAGESAVTGHALPPEGDQDHGAERGTEPGPGVGDERQHEAVRVTGDDDRDDGNEKHHAAAENHQFAVACLRVNQTAVEVLRER